MKELMEIAPAALDANQASQYLGMSRSHFLDVVRPLCKPADLGRPGSKRGVIRWRRADLDAYLASRVGV